MGLDGIELVMDVEDHFGITIQHAEAVHVRTVGDLVVLIQRRIAAAHEAHCPTLPAFLKLRTSVRGATGDDAFRIRPRQRIVDRLTVLQRRELWKRLADLLGSPPYPLRRPKILRRILAATAIALLGLSLISAAAIDIRIWPLTLPVAALGILLLHFATTRFRTVPPDEWATFGDLTAKIAGVTVATRRLELRAADDILDELRPLIVTALGVNAEEVVAEARLVEDLGVG